MSFVATKYDAQFAHRVLSNLTTLLERDTEAAILELDPDLPLFKDFRTPVLIALNFPALFVSVDQAQLEQSADDSHIRSTITFTVDLAIVGANAFDLQAQLVKYVLAIDRVIRTAVGTDFVGEITTTNSKPAWEVTGHSFQLMRNDTILRAEGSLTVVIQLFER